MSTASPDDSRRFSSVLRLRGAAALAAYGNARVCVVGIGGVGSWAAEALARSGVGHLGLVDLDHVAESNINRQAHALDATVGKAKVQAMGERIAAINPRCSLALIDDFITPENAAALLAGFDLVIDAIDQVRAKVAMIAFCRAEKIPLIVAGGAGGKSDPGCIRIADLAHTEQDPLLAKVRSRLRREHAFPRQGKFGISAVYSTETQRLPAAADCAAPSGSGINCAGFGSSVCITASFGFFAAAAALQEIERRSA